MNSIAMTGQQMKALRLQKRYSQVEWGRILGLSQSQVSEMETDHGTERVSEELARRALEAPVQPERKRKGTPPRDEAAPAETRSAQEPPEAPQAQASPPPPSPPVLPPVVTAALEAFTLLLTTLNGHLAARYEAQARQQRQQSARDGWEWGESPPAPSPETGQALTTPAPSGPRAQLPAGSVPVMVSAGDSAPAASTPVSTEPEMPADEAPPAPSAPPPHRGPATSRWKRVQEGWRGYALTALVTLCISWLLFRSWGTSPAHESLPNSTAARREEPSQPKSEPAPLPWEEAPDGGVVSSKPVSGRPLPKKPFKGQKHGPCDARRGEIEIDGECYWKLEAEVCPEEWFEHENKCVKPVPARKDEPVATDPDDDTHPDKPTPSVNPGPRDH